jgi:hypothetical protein
MKVKYIAVVILLISIATATQAQTKATAIKSGRSFVRLLEKESQKTLPGARGAEPVTQFHFILVWKNEDAPQCFFWRGENGWLSCNIAKAHKLPRIKKSAPGKLPYITESISTDNIQKGDTLDLAPVRGGKFPVPGDIPDKAKNTLYFKTANTNWLAVPVRKIARKKDVITP